MPAAMACTFTASFLVHYFLCGPEGSVDAGVDTAAGLELVSELAIPGVLWEGAVDSVFGALGAVVIALSGLSRWSLLGPSPKLISARESGTVLLCQP